MEYFSDSYSTDKDIMTLVIEAVEKYSKAEPCGYKLIARGVNLEQTDETVQWILNELNSEVNASSREVRDCYYYNLSRIVKELNPGLLSRYKSDILESYYLHNGIKDYITRFLEIYSWGPEKCWQELEELSKNNSNKPFSEINSLFADHLMDALMYNGTEYADKIVEMLKQNMIVDYKNYPMTLMESYMLRLAGKMRLKLAIPYIVNMLYIEDADYLWEISVAALKKIGTDDVVKPLYKEIPKAEWGFRLFSCGVFKDVHTPLAVNACLDLIKQEENLMVRTSLARNLLTQFSFAGLDYVYGMVKEEEWDYMYCDLKGKLVSACITMDKTYPEHNEWYQDCLNKRKEQEERAKSSIFREMQPKINSRIEKIGRNEPCYCGSGKKFKKCCGNK